MLSMREVFAFSAAHSLPTFPDGHKCRKVHGHTWKVVVDVPIPNHSSIGQGYCIDHADLRESIWARLRELDHANLNEVVGIERGLAEDILGWIVNRLVRNRPPSESDPFRPHRIELIECSSSNGHWVEHSKVWTAGT